MDEKQKPEASREEQVGPYQLEEQVPQSDLISSASPDYVALEVEESPWSVAPDKHSVEALMVLFEGVCEGVRRMSRACPDTREPHPRWRLRLAFASAAVCALLACWTPHKLKAPCPDELYEHQGECYVPAFSAKQPLPQSLEQ